MRNLSFTENARQLQETAALIGGQLRDLRDKAKKTQAQVAAETGIDVTQISRLENGQQIHLIALHRRALVDALGEGVNLLLRMTARASAYYESQDFATRAAILRYWAAILSEQEEDDLLAEPGPVDRALVDKVAGFVRLPLPLAAEDANEIWELLGRTRGGVPRL